MKCAPHIKIVLGGTFVIKVERFPHLDVGQGVEIWRGANGVTPNLPQSSVVCMQGGRPDVNP
jgi:hypothetical protein